MTMPDEDAVRRRKIGFRAWHRGTREMEEMKSMDMTVSVDGDLAEFIESQVASGRFRSSGDLVREALRLMETAERNDAERLRWLRSTWRDGVDSGDAGEIDFSALKAEARERRTAPES